MDETDYASQHEETERAALIRVARAPNNSPIAKRRSMLADARLIASQRSPNDPELAALDLSCENGCGEPLTIENEDIFCCKDCADDWARRERARVISGR